MKELKTHLIEGFNITSEVIPLSRCVKVKMCRGKESTYHLIHNSLFEDFTAEDIAFMLSIVFEDFAT